MPTSSLHCPNCGAPAAPDATRCDYCGSRLATVACPSCFGSVFAGTQFCPHCGTKIPAPEAVEDGKTLPLPLHCPGCSGDMKPVQLAQTPMHSCDQCGSTWLAPNDFAALCADREARGAVMTALGASGVAPTPPTPGKVRYVHCPVCDKVMNRVNFGKMSGIVVDVCKNHGVWFERDELRGVLQFVANGGLDRMRAADAERNAAQAALGLNTTPKPDLASFAAITLSRDIHVGPAGAKGDDAVTSMLRFVLESLFK